MELVVPSEREGQVDTGLRTKAWVLIPGQNSSLPAGSSGVPVNGDIESRCSHAISLAN